MKPFAYLALFALITINGCSCKDDPDVLPDASEPVEVPEEVLKDLRHVTLSPGEVTLRTEGAPATQTWAAIGHYRDDSTRDVTEWVTFSLDDPRLGSFSGAAFTSTVDIGGTTKVRAILDTYSAEATLNLVFSRSVEDDGPGSDTLPSNPGDFFTGAPSEAHAPLLVYPNDGVLVPPNLRDLEFHFRRGHPDNTLFELRFQSALTDIRVQLRCHLPADVEPPSGVNDGCIYLPSATVWHWLAETNRGGDPIQVTLRATDDSGAGPVGTSAPLQVNIARSELKGAMYYWRAHESHEGTGIMRYDFAAPEGTMAELAVGPVQPGNVCVGCHALSRDGKKMVASAGGSGPARVLLWDVSEEEPKVPFDSTPKSAFHAWSPDGSRYVGVHTYQSTGDPRLLMFDGETGQLIGSETIDVGGSLTQPPTHPDWSSDGQTIAYVHAGQVGAGNSQNVQNIWHGSIRMVQRDGAGWTSPTVIVPRAEGRNRYYPAISPDSSFLAYNESVCPAGTTMHGACDSDTDPTATLWTARLVASAPRVRLERANAPGLMDLQEGRVALTNSYPKWSPFEVRGSDGPESRLNWLTFSSTRRYGLRKAPPGKSDASGTLLWMAAVDPDRAQNDEDGSHPAFALPFQDIHTSNHIAQWAQYAVVDGCATEGDGCGFGGGACCNGLSCTPLSSDPPLPCDVEGACVCRVVETCGLTGDSCSASNPCCGALTCANPGGGECQGDDCLCQPTCGALGQSCGTGSPCCGGLLCLGPGATACEGEDCSCMPGID